MSDSPSPAPSTPCSVCSKPFVPRISYQIERHASGVTRAYCSLPCRASAQTSSGAARCSVCEQGFTLTFAYQAQRTASGQIRYVCSEVCKQNLSTPKPASAPTKPYRVAVLNQKGGTGKTTTSISLAAGFAEAGHRVLLVDADPQGNVGVSLGVRSAKSLYHVLVEDAAVDDVVVPLGNHFDVLTSDDSLAAAEIKLAQNPTRGGVLKRKLEATTRYTHVIVDCSPSLSLLNQNALCYVDEVLVPVACDYLSLVGVKQVLKTVHNIQQHLGHPLRIGAVLPTFYDARAKICRDALETLQKHFGALCLPPIRSNTKLKEAPSHKRTIYEHDPSSTGAEDYRNVVRLMLTRTQEQTTAATTTTPRHERQEVPLPVAMPVEPFEVAALGVRMQRSRA